MPTWIALALPLTVALIALFVAGRAIKISVRHTELPRSILRDLISRVEVLEATGAETADTLKIVANRVKMQRVRTAANHVSDPPTADDKDALRRRAGLTAGLPARHQ